jgi:hypothetical protein
MKNKSYIKKNGGIMQKVLFTLVSLVLLSINAMAAESVTVCSNDLENVSLKLVKSNNKVLSLEVDIPGLLQFGEARNDFKYTTKDITAAGEVFVFEKAGISATELMIQKVSETTTLAMVKLHYRGQTQINLLKCN